MRKFIVILLGFTGFVAATPCSADFCGDLKAVLAASAKLSNLADKPLSANTWQAKQSVATFSNCVITKSDDGTVVFRCQRPKASPFATVKREYDGIRKELEKCLPDPPWGTMSNSSGEMQMASYFNSAEKLSAQVAINKTIDFADRNGKREMVDFWYVGVNVYERR